MIIPMEKRHSGEVFGMMRDFYDSDAVIHTSSDGILEKDISDCLDPDNPFIEGYVFETDGDVSGYAMVSKNYSTEYATLCIWIEDLYVKEKYRGRRLATDFLSYIEEKYGDIRYKLEVEPENTAAVEVYRRCGYREMGYIIMSKDLKKD